MSTNPGEIPDLPEAPAAYLVDLGDGNKLTTSVPLPSGTSQEAIVQALGDAVAARRPEQPPETPAP